MGDEQKGGGHVMGDQMRGERLQIMLAPEELAAIDDFRFKHRMPTRAAAVRELLSLGLASVSTDAGPGMKSSSYGVFGRGVDGNRSHDGEGETGPEGAA